MAQGLPGMSPPIFLGMMMKINNPRTIPKKKKKSGATRWALHVFLLTLLLSSAMTLASDLMMQDARLVPALLVLFSLILLGVFTDMLGVAITSADQAPFIAMASKRVRGAKQSLYILKNAERFANICNDVIGDICGIISGTAGAAIAALLTLRYGALSAVAWAVLTSAFISAVTVSLKALGKGVAMDNSRQLVHFMGRLFSFFSR
jgi:hypothetical protein